MIYPLEPADFERADVLRSHRREWKVDRIGWIIIAMVLIVATLGGFGGGPLAYATRSGAAVHMDFDHLVRHGVPTELRLEVGPEAVTNGRFQVWLDEEFLETVDFRDVRPTPAGSISSGGRLTFEFAAPAAGETGHVVFEIARQDGGSRLGHLGVSGGTTLDFEQIVFP